MDLKSIIADSLSIIKEVGLTASEVNKKSLQRKDIANRGLVLMEKLLVMNSRQKSSIERVRSNLEMSLHGNPIIKGEVSKNISVLTGVIGYLNTIKKDFSRIENEIGTLRTIVNEVKKDTDRIFSLALNASIVSSKYTSTSGVFDVLANKLNDMSNFINQNLETIIKVVKPITEGVQKLIQANELVIMEIEKGKSIYLEIPEILEKQNDSMSNLLKQATDSSVFVDDQYSKLGEINAMLQQMQSDADGAIIASANNVNFANNLAEEVRRLLQAEEFDDFFKKHITSMIEKSNSVHDNATKVNLKSNNQFEFTTNCQKFAESVVFEANEIIVIAELFGRESNTNSKVSEKISESLQLLTTQLAEVEENMQDSGRTIHKFNDDYKQIDRIIEFLKSVLKSMQLIGMYSRIESARDEVMFEGFINISANITKLQMDIQNNIPVIETNINETHVLINSVNSTFKKISSDFSFLSESLEKIIQHLKDFVKLSTEIETEGTEIVGNSTEIKSSLEEVSVMINQLSEIVKYPIKGSSDNIQRGTKLETMYRQVLSMVLTEMKDQSQK